METILEAAKEYIAALFATENNANARTFAFGGQHQRPLSDSVKHFHEKLLLLKDEMNTEAGKKMAQLRHSRMVEFLDALTQEGFL